jgi:hypothetical protein
MPENETQDIAFITMDIFHLKPLYIVHMYRMLLFPILEVLHDVNILHAYCSQCVGDS